MKVLSTSLAFLSFTVWVAAETNQLHRSGNDFVTLRLTKAHRSHVPLSLPTDHGKDPVLLMEPIESPTLQACLPGFILYRLISTTDLIHYANFSALAIDTNHVPHYIRTDRDAVLFLNDQASRAESCTEAEALRLVRAFAELRSYKIVESSPTFADVRAPEKQPQPIDTDYKFVAEEGDGFWKVHVTCFTSDYSASFERYSFEIRKSGGIIYDMSEPVLIRLRSYVY